MLYRLSTSRWLDWQAQIDYTIHDKPIAIASKSEESPHAKTLCSLDLRSCLTVGRLHLAITYWTQRTEGERLLNILGGAF
jgi:hypothetical protein